LIASARRLSNGKRAVPGSALFVQTFSLHDSCNWVSIKTHSFCGPQQHPKGPLATFDHCPAATILNGPACIPPPSGFFLCLARYVPLERRRPAISCWVLRAPPLSDRRNKKLPDPFLHLKASPPQHHHHQEGPATSLIHLIGTLTLCCIHSPVSRDFLLLVSSHCNCARRLEEQLDSELV
jgi:hypothetical protein